MKLTHDGCSFALIVIFLLVPAAFAFNLPDTGQTRCYQGGSPYAEMSCEGTGQDGAYIVHPMWYTDNGNGTVTDNNTGLVWQKQADNAKRTWQAASAYCSGLSPDGKTGWRLPTKKELFTLVDYSVPFPGPMIHPVFMNTKAGPDSFYWSSTADAVDPVGAAWHVDFGFGFLYSDPKSSDWYVRCVRMSQPAQLLLDNGDTVTDQGTGLEWQKQDDNIQRTWAQALSLCNSLSLSNQTDWRLPNIKELESISDDSKYDPTISPVFPTVHYMHWSSTNSSTPADPSHGSDSALTLDFYDGSIGYAEKSLSFGYYARCVRGGQSGSLGRLSVQKTSFCGLDATGSGTVASSPAGIDCGSTCSALFPTGGPVMLSATPATSFNSKTFSIFSGWWGGGACTDGVVTVSSDTAVTCTATFCLCEAPIGIGTIAPRARININAGYLSIGEAYAAASLLDKIRVTASNEEGALDLNGEKHVTLEGGYDCRFQRSTDSYTTLTGSLTISSGEVTLDRIVIR